MNKIKFIVAALLLLTTVAFGKPAADTSDAPSQTVLRVDAQQSFEGPPNWFTGSVKIDMVFPPNETAHYSGAYVTFQPGARTAWHLHPAGQHILVTEGTALTGTRNGKVVECKAGDAIWCPPDIDHWHGASPDAPMKHFVITGYLDGKNVVWKEHVTDEQYKGIEE